MKDKKTEKTIIDRPESETHITKRPDRVKKYLKKRLKEFTFSELKPEYLKKTGLEKEFSGVPVPLRAEDRKAFDEKGWINSKILADNMVQVIGIDPGFNYTESYRIFIEKLYGKRAVNRIDRKGEECADKEKFEDACIYFRAGLAMVYNDLHTMYCYAKILMQLYNNGKSEEYIGNLKAESIEYFEMITEFYPEFDMGWYYTGYIYLNLGLYLKAKLAWEQYMKIGREFKYYREIKQRLEQIEQPVRMEEGCNAVLSEKWEKGIEILTPFKEGRYDDYWPLWYYLGIAYANTDRSGDAIKAFKKVLKLNPRNVDSIEELIELFKEKGDEVAVKKYRDKLALIKKQSQE